MTVIKGYLTFSGKCSDALTFYKECLGGELTMQKFSDSPMANQMPPEMKDNILHAMLSNNGVTLMGSDMGGMQGVAAGNAITLMLNCSSEEEIRNYFSKLSVGGKVSHPLEDTFWGAMLGDFTDKYGIPWMLHFDKNAKQ
jgi:PhnB protein